MPKSAFCAAIAITLACLGTAEARPAHRVPAAAMHHDNGVHPALWTVHGAKGTAYLFGSVHVLPSGLNWKFPTLLAAMKRSDTFVFEIPLDHQDQDRVEAARVQK